MKAAAPCQLVSISPHGTTCFPSMIIRCFCLPMDANAKKSLELVLAEFRKGIAHHRAEGATEERIRQILSASIRLTVKEVHDPRLCIWLCDEFSEAAKVPSRKQSLTKPNASLWPPQNPTRLEHFLQD